MPKKIIVCIDGTWNNPTVPTNVYILFDLLAGTVGDSKIEDGVTTEIEKSNSDQVAKYFHGVGDIHDPFLRKVEGIFGFGIVPKILQGYVYIAEKYTEEDKIYICGFSRGATAARAIADLIAANGLLLKRESDSAHNFNWRCKRFLEKHFRAIFGDEKKSLITRLFEDARFPYNVPPPSAERLKGMPPKSAGNLSKPYQADETDDEINKNVPVEAVAVWDSVEALTPLADSEEATLNILQENLNPNILNGYHAISIDENRTAFAPALWNPRKRVEQCLFPGAHSDVGGGYSPNEGGLSNNALFWMMNKLPKNLFADLNLAQQKYQKDALGIAHRSDTVVPFHLLQFKSRIFPPITSNIGVHQSVMSRWGHTVPIKLDSSKAVIEEVYKPAHISLYVADGKRQSGVTLEV